ncbi:IS5/IS1182 family transposase, partial [Streptomyces sp. NPDC002920]
MTSSARPRGPAGAEATTSAGPATGTAPRADRNGLPLSLAVSGANMHDSQRLEALVRGIRH